MKYIFILWLCLTLIGPLWVLLTGQVDLKSHYSTANRDSAHLAPLPEVTQEAVIQAYAARAFNWRGIMASHCWLAVKARGAAQYRVYQVIGWRTYRDMLALAIIEDIPDRNWFNQKPQVILDIRGSKAETLIPKIEAAVEAYPYAGPYTLWPGPNSNTFPAYIGRQVPELQLTLPSDAIGKDFLPKGAWFAKTPSGTGYQFSLYGVLGVSIAKREGIELNILGLVYGIKFSPFAILLPGWGR